MKKILGTSIVLILCAFPALAQDSVELAINGLAAMARPRPQWHLARDGFVRRQAVFCRVLARPRWEGLFRTVHRRRAHLYDVHPQRRRKYAVCLDAGNGEVLWRTRTDHNLVEGQGGDGPRATPTVDGKMVYVFSAYGKLHALDSQTGTQQWSHDLVREFGSKKPNWGFCASPLVEGDLVLIEAGGKDGQSLIAFDKTSGKVAWATGSDKTGYSSPIATTIGQTRQAVFFTGDGLISATPQHGQVLWKHPWKTSHEINIATPVFIPPNRFFISSDYGTGGSVVEVNRYRRRL